MPSPTARPKADIDRKGLIDDMGAGLTAVYKAIQQIQNARVLIPLLLYFVFKLALLLLYTESGAGRINDFWALALWGEASAGLEHYPQHLFLLPQVMSRLDIVLDVFVYVIAQGATVLLVAAFYRGERRGIGYAFSGTLRRYGHIVGVMIVATVAIAAAARVASLPSRFGWIPHNRYIITGGSVLLGLAVQAFFIYCIPFVLLKKRSAIGAVMESFRLSGRRYLTAATLVVVPFVVTSPTFLLGFKAHVIALRLFPELLIYIQVLSEVMNLIASYLLAGAIAVRFTEEAGAARETAP
jgi:hypothetical protein